VAKYQVAIYNKWVRDRVRAGDDPPKGIDPAWEEVYYFDTEDFVEGHKRWGMIFQEEFNASAATYHLVPDEQTYS